jgi:hypothetical protein
MEGWIKIHRKIQRHWLYQEKREYSHFEAWIDLLMQVNHTEAKVLIKGVLFEVKRGESINSLETWSRRWNWNKSKVRRFLILLQKENMIDYKSETQTTRITICNYDSYQETRNADETQMKRKRNADETPVNPNKNEENNKTNELTNENESLDVPTKVETPPKKKVLFTECSMLDFEPEKQKAFEIAKGFWQLFGANLKEIGAPLANIKKADAKEWTRQIALMLKNKEATVDQLREVYDFLKVDEFWKPNVQSVPKLREKFTTIYSQSKKPKNGTNSTGGLSEEGKLRILEKLASGARFQEEQRQKHASQMHNE